MQRIRNQEPAEQSARLPPPRSYWATVARIEQENTMPDTPDLISNAYTISGLLGQAVEEKLRLTISTVEGISSTGVPVQFWTGEGGLVTLTEGDDVWFVPLAQITKITPSPAYAPVSVHTL